MNQRLDALRHLLEKGKLTTQDELRKKLKKMHFDVTQSTISRDLRKLQAVRAIDQAGQVVYRLEQNQESNAAETEPLGKYLAKNMVSAGSVAVIHTAPGSAPLVARHLDMNRPEGILGTIAGDDTIFLALSSNHQEAKVMKDIREVLERLN